jgi:hypothetical protein
MFRLIAIFRGNTILQKTGVFWDVAPCTLVKINRRFRGAYCSIILAMSRTL